jgi:hypothetical protein
VLVSTTSCSGKTCSLELVLAFDSFTSDKSYELSGKVALKLSTVRRHLEGSDQVDSGNAAEANSGTFAVTFLAVANDEGSSARVTSFTAAAGGLMSVVAIAMI